VLDELNREITELQEQLRRRQKLANDLAAAKESLQHEQARLAALSADLAREGADVKRLEGLSLTGLFYTVLGSRDEQLEKERQEYLAAKLRHDECWEAVSALEGEALHLQQQLSGLRDLDARYQAALAQKEAALVEAGGANAARLAQLARETAGANADIRELGEALAAAKAALEGLRGMIGSLESAADWGTWDLLGGGTVTTLVKHARIDDARAGAHRVQQLLRRLQRELADVSAQTPDLTVDIGALATFADFFFDGLISDWIVQSKMAKSLENARRVQEQVRTLQKRLERELAAARLKAAALEAERQQLIAG